MLAGNSEHANTPGHGRSPYVVILGWLRAAARPSTVGFLAVYRTGSDQPITDLYPLQPEVLKSTKVAGCSNRF